MADQFGFFKGDDPAFPNFQEDGGIVDVSGFLTFQMVPMDGRRLGYRLRSSGAA